MAAIQAQAALNCIVDDSALVASVRNKALHSIKPWLSQGAINVFVPLYALDRLSQLRHIRCPVSNDAARAIEWLDHITTTTENKVKGRVQLQGPDDQYETWEEVEKFLLPDTPLTADNGSSGVDALSRMLGQGLSLNGEKGSMTAERSQVSPSASPASTTSSLSTNGAQKGAQDECSTTLLEHGIPPSARPLLNFTVWRNHHEDASFATPGKFILVTNDPIVQKQASKFGVRAKLLSQIQNILGKKTAPVAGLDGSTSPMETASEDVFAQELSDDEEKVTYDPSQRPGSSRGPKQASNVFDPDHFGRSPKVTQRAVNDPKRGTMEPFRSPRGSPRGRGQTVRANGNVSKGYAGNGFVGGRGYGGTSPGRNPGMTRGRGTMAGGRGAKPVYPCQIDPDSYARPAPGRRGRGGYSRLWEPTSSG